MNDVGSKAADVVAATVLPVNIALWLSDIDFVLRVLVSIGSLILIGFAIAAKVKHWKK